jgi:hypothetical protein
MAPPTSGYSEKHCREVEGSVLIRAGGKKMKNVALFSTLLLVAVLAGCRSHMTTFKLINNSAEPISTIIVDYPSATFGKDKLAPNETFSSSVKVTDTGALKVQFSDAKGSHHSYTGPLLRPNAESDIEISFTQESATTAIKP